MPADSIARRLSVSKEGITTHGHGGRFIPAGDIQIIVLRSARHQRRLVLALVWASGLLGLAGWLAFSFNNCLTAALALVLTFLSGAIVYSLMRGGYLVEVRKRQGRYTVFLFGASKLEAMAFLYECRDQFGYSVQLGDEIKG